MINNVSLVLVILSALIHPLWNMLLKRSEDKVIFYLNIHLIYTLLFSFILFIFPLKNVTISGWIFVILSAFAHFFYQIFLCQTYELGDLSLTYPIVRSSPIFVTIFGLIFLKEIPSLPAIVGIILVIYGVYVINQKSLSLLEFIRPFKILYGRTMLFAVSAAFWSAVYSVVDKKGALSMSPILFFYLFFAISGFLFIGYLLSFKERRKNYWRILKRDKYKITQAALLQFSSYILILYAFCISKVAYVVALRQISVIFGVIFGIVFLKEHYGKVRFFASCIIFVGAFLIIAFG